MGLLYIALFEVGPGNPPGDLRLPRRIRLLGGDLYAALNVAGLGPAESQLQRHFSALVRG